MENDPKRKLYKIKVEVEICAYCQNEKEAVQVAKDNAQNEIKEYSTCSAFTIDNIASIPKSWVDSIPYMADGALQEIKTCKQIVSEMVPVVNKKEVGEEAQAILDIHANIVTASLPTTNEVYPETRKDPVVKELAWKETNTGRSMPQLRFLKK